MGVSASFADKLMDGFICYLERQEDTTLSFLATIDHTSWGIPFFRLAREGLLRYESFAHDAERTIINKLNIQDDEEVIITFTKRKKSVNHAS